MLMWITPVVFAFLLSGSACAEKDEETGFIDDAPAAVAIGDHSVSESHKVAVYIRESNDQTPAESVYGHDVHDDGYRRRYPNNRHYGSNIGDQRMSDHRGYHNDGIIRHRGHIDDERYHDTHDSGIHGNRRPLIDSEGNVINDRRNKDHIIEDNHGVYHEGRAGNHIHGPRHHSGDKFNTYRMKGLHDNGNHYDSLDKLDAIYGHGSRRGSGHGKSSYIDLGRYNNGLRGSHHGLRGYGHGLGRYGHSHRGYGNGYRGYDRGHRGYGHGLGGHGRGFTGYGPSLRENGPRFRGKLYRDQLGYRYNRPHDFISNKFGRFGSRNRHYNGHERPHYGHSTSSYGSY